MSEIKAQAQTEPDPSATSISNDQTVNDAPTQDATTNLSAAPTTTDDAAKAEAMTEKQTEAPAETEDRISEMAGEGKTATKPESEKTEGDEKRNGNHSPSAKRNFRGDSNENINKRPKRDVKSSYDDLPESDDTDEIRRQVEFYFSDSNLPTDKYLLTKTGGQENIPFPLKEIHNFKRMRHFQPFSAVLSAVKTSNVLDVTDDGMITRKTPLSEDFTDDVEKNRDIHQDRTMDRSIYAKGFGEEERGSQLEIEEFFAPYGTINSVRLRRERNGHFKGSVFVEFAEPQMVKDFLELDPKPKWHDAHELQIKSKKEYCDGKVEAIRDGTVRPRSPRREQQRRGGGRGDDNWNDRRDRDQRGGGRGGRGRGGGGRGRGGRGGRGRDDRRNGDRNEERRRRDDDERNERREDRVEAESKKRAHEDDGGAQQTEAKKAKASEE